MATHENYYNQGSKELPKLYKNAVVLVVQLGGKCWDYKAIVIGKW